jgi:prepilin-type N-terminal cleavage/methylation domain-containing protein
MHHSKSRLRGMTLIELMISVGISSIVIAAAVAMMVAVVKQRRESERYVELQTTNALGFARFSFDLQSAGFRFPSSAIGFRVYNNISGSTVVGAGEPFPITTSAFCGTATVGLVPGSDVIEFASGWETVSPGQLTFVSGVGSIRNYSLGGDAPFTPVEVRDGAILLFVERSGESCMGRHVVGSAGQLEMLSPTYQPEGSPGIRYPGCPTTNGTARVYRLQQRVRYMVCRNQNDPDAVPVLHRQASDVGGAFTALPVALEPGVDDMQVAIQMADPANTLTGSCTAATPGQPRLCTCNETVACGNYEEVPNTIGPNTPNNFLRAVTIGLLARGSRGSSNRDEFIRPALFDRPAANAPDSRFKFLASQRTFNLYNFTQVSP